MRNACEKAKNDKNELNENLTIIEKLDEAIITTTTNNNNNKSVQIQKQNKKSIRTSSESSTSSTLLSTSSVSSNNSTISLTGFLTNNKLNKNIKTVASLSTLAKVAATTAKNNNNNKRNKNQKSLTTIITKTTTTTINNNNNGIVSIKHSNRIPSDILDDLASRFVINVPDIELTNLIRVCFQVELAHWFYLDFFCSTISKHHQSQQQHGERKKLKQQKEQQQQQQQQQQLDNEKQQQTEQQQQQLLSSSSSSPPTPQPSTTTIEEAAGRENDLSANHEFPSNKLQPCGIKYFALQLFEHIPFLRQHSSSVDKILEDWKNYKLSVPTFGAILVSEDLNYCLLVQSYFAKTSWGFPKGKVNENEDPVHCATREVYEETGYDITNIIDPNDYIEAVINYQYTRLYIVRNVSLSTQFAPRTRYEIRCCDWFPIDSLPVNKSDALSKSKLGIKINSFFMIMPFVKRLKRWVNDNRTPLTTTTVAAALPEIATATTTLATEAAQLNTITTVATISATEMSASTSASVTSPTSNKNPYTPSGILLNNGTILKIGGSHKSTQNDNSAAITTTTTPTSSSSSSSITTTTIMNYNNNMRAGRVASAFTNTNANTNTNDINIKNVNNNNTNNIHNNNQNMQLNINKDDKNYANYTNTKPINNNNNNNNNNIINEIAVNNNKYKINHSQSAIKMPPAMERLRGRQRHKSMGDLDAESVFTLQTTTAKSTITKTMETAATANNAKTPIMKTVTTITTKKSETKSSFTPTSAAGRKTNYTSSSSSSSSATVTTPIAATNINVNAKRQLFHSYSVNEVNESMTDTQQQQQQHSMQKKLPACIEKNVAVIEMVTTKYQNHNNNSFKMYELLTPQPQTNQIQHKSRIFQRSRTQSQGEQHNLHVNAHNNNNNNNKQKKHTNNHNNNANNLHKQRSWTITNKQYATKNQNQQNNAQEKQQEARNCYSARATPIQGLMGCLTLAANAANEQVMFNSSYNAVTSPLSSAGTKDLLAIASAAAADVVASATPINTYIDTPSVPCVPTIQGAIAKLHKSGKCTTPPVLPNAGNVCNDWPLVGNVIYPCSASAVSSAASAASSFSGTSPTVSAHSDSPIHSLSPSPIAFKQQQQQLLNIKHPEPILTFPGKLLQSPITTAAELEAFVLQAAKQQQQEQNLKAAFLEQQQQQQQQQKIMYTNADEENAVGGEMNATKITPKPPISIPVVQADMTEFTTTTTTTENNENENSEQNDKITINAWTNFTFTKSFMSNLFY